MRIQLLLYGSLMMLGVDSRTRWPFKNHSSILDRSGSDSEIRTQSFLTDLTLLITIQDTVSTSSNRSIASNYFYQIFYLPNNVFMRNPQCCTIGNYSNITGVSHQTSASATDLVTAEFTPSTIAAVPFVLITGAGRPTDYTALEVTGECLTPGVFQPGPNSDYYYYFSQFFTAAQ